MDTASQPGKSRKYTFIIVGGVILVALIAYIASRSGLDKELLRQQVDAFAKAMHDSAARQGRDVTFTYSDITIEGSFSGKHGVIHNPKVTIKPEKPSTDGKDNSLVISSDAIEVYAKAVDLSAIQVQLPKPIDFTSESDPAKKLLTIQANNPLVFDVALSEENKVQYLDVVHAAPTKLDFTYLHEKQAEGVEDQTPTIVPVYKTITITMAPGGKTHSYTSTDGRNLGNAMIDLHDIHLIPQGVPNGEITITEFTMNSSNQLNEKKQSIGSLKLHLGDITGAPELLPYAPISLSIDGNYEGKPIQTPEDVAAASEVHSSLKLNKFELSSKEAKLTATADFASRNGDILPEGTANITLTNVPYVLKELHDNGLLSQDRSLIVVPVLEMTTGQKITDIKDAVIDINRPHGGAFTIGKTTFEELFATILKGTLIKSQAGAPATPAPNAKPGDKPTEKPAAPDAKKGAMIVEDSARG